MNEVEDFDDEEEDRYKKLVRILAERHSGVQTTITFAPLPTFLPPMFFPPSTLADILAAVATLNAGTCACPAKGSSYSNMHSLSCPKFISTHCTCHNKQVPAHGPECTMYRRPDPPKFEFTGIVTKAGPLLIGSGVGPLGPRGPPGPPECTCAAASGVIGHASFCPALPASDPPCTACQIEAMDGSAEPFDQSLHSPVHCTKLQKI
jgi:hypothetical protein